MFLRLFGFPPQIHEKEEQEMNEKNDNASCLNEEPLISADQVIKGIFVSM